MNGVSVPGTSCSGSNPVWPTFFGVGFPREPTARCGNHSLKKLDQKHPDPPYLAASPLGFPRSLRDLAPLGPGGLPHFVRQMLLPNSLFHNLDFLVGQPVQLVHDFVDQVVRALDLRLQFVGAFLRLDVAL